MALTCQELGINSFLLNLSYVIDTQREDKGNTPKEWKLSGVTS